jgi:hypothetical protein
MGEVESLMLAQPDTWLTTLTEDYKIHVVRDGDLVSLKYNQIESPMREPIAQECRGMVVDVVRRKVMAHPYNKFWNHGDVLAAAIDWPTARVLEKLDGSLMILYWDDRTEEWAVASSGTPRAGGAFGDDEQTFRDVFWGTFQALGMREPAPLWRGTCFMFELCSMGNRIVVKYEDPRLVLHGGRFIDDGAELSHSALTAVSLVHDWELVKSYPIASIEDCLAAADALDPINCEGFIVVDAQFNRIKIKSPRYVILHHMKGEATLRRSIELWQTGETEELLLHFPEFAPKILPVHERLEEIALTALQHANRLQHLTRKDYAAEVKQTRYSAIAFKLYGTDTDWIGACAIMRGQSTQALERMLEAAP